MILCLFCCLVSISCLIFQITDFNDVENLLIMVHSFKLPRTCVVIIGFGFVNFLSPNLLCLAWNKIFTHSFKKQLFIFDLPPRKNEYDIVRLNDNSFLSN